MAREGWVPLRHRSTLLGTARRLELVDESELKRLGQALKKLECRQSGLTPTNRLRLAQFDDPAHIARLLDLPDKLLSLARERCEIDRDSALLVQMAVAVLILIFTGIRLRNLGGCHIERNIVRAGPARRHPRGILFERQEVKNPRGARQADPAHTGSGARSLYRAVPPPSRRGPRSRLAVSRPHREAQGQGGPGAADQEDDPR